MRATGYQYESGNLLLLLNVQNKACRRAEPLIGFRANVGFLVKLLLLVAAREVGMHCSSWLDCAVECAAVPGMRIEDHHRSGGRGEQDFIRVSLSWICHHITGGFAAALRT